MTESFEMVAKTFQGLEDVLAEELRGLGALNVEPGRRMVSFEGDLEMLYKANLCCRTALRILKPVYKFYARNTDELYEHVKEYNWGELMTVGSTFSIDTVAYSDDFTHSRFVTYRVKDAIVDWFKDRYGEDHRPGVRLQDADVMINVHIAANQVTLSLDSSGESLHKRGYRVAQTEAPINEVLAAGIILRSGWRGDCPLVDPMCGSGTFLIEAALIAANVNPGVFRKHYAFENWKDFNAELFDRLYNDDSAEREFTHKIYGADISPKAIEIARSNIRSAGVGKYIDLAVKPLSEWHEAPEDGILITNPPYGERITTENMEGLYTLIGSKLKNVFKGYHAWIIAAKNEYVNKIGLAPSVRMPILNGSIECELREYIIFEGDYKSFRREGHRLREVDDARSERRPRPERKLRPDRPEKGYRGEKGFRSEKPDRDGDRRREFSKDRRDFRRDGAPRGDERPFSEKRRADRRENRAGEPRNELEKLYRPGSRPGRGDRSDRRDDRDRRPAAPVSDNPLAVRRNEAALRSITGKQPSLPPMRKRRNTPPEN